jgi:glycosyltransferase involved in cell wall biosynthesis
MNIAFIVPSLANKGPIILVRQLINFLTINKVHCEVYYFDSIHELEFPCLTHKISFFEKIDFNRYDIIHSHLFRPDLYCAFHKRIGNYKVKFISTIHTAIYDDLNFTYGRLKSYVIVKMWLRSWKASDQLVVLSESAKSYYQKTQLKPQIVINNGLDLPSHPNSIPANDHERIEGIKKNYTLLGTVCSIDKRKGLEQIIKLLIKKKEFAFLIIGNGIEGSRLDQLARSNGVGDRFIILGFRKDGYRYLRYFDLFLIPSRSEGMPMALLEAMAARVPVVCSDIPAFTNEFSIDQFSFFKLDSTESMLNACKYALYNSEKLTSLSFDSYKRNYTINVMGKKYSNLYKSLIARL